MKQTLFSLLALVFLISSCSDLPSGNKHIQKADKGNEHLPIWMHKKSEDHGLHYHDDEHHSSEHHEDESQLVKQTELVFTAYKTTDKVGVPGTFKDIKFFSSKHETNEEHELTDDEGSIEKVMNGGSFKILTKSLSTANAVRDSTVLVNYFYSMISPEYIKGSFKNFKDGKGEVEIEMNGTKNILPVTYQTEGNSILFQGTFKMEDWKLENSLSKIAKACYELHKGLDGVSKTWDIVDIKGTVELK